jgi:hypothetical protein
VPVDCLEVFGDPAVAERLTRLSRVHDVSCVSGVRISGSRATLARTTTQPVGVSTCAKVPWSSKVEGDEPMAERNPRDVAREIIDANLYMVLATADENGRPWASPVYFANAGYTEFIWVSSPEATHSCNIARRPDVGIVIFDSRVPIGTGQGVYMTAVAEAVEPVGIERAIDVFSRRSLAHGGVEWTTADVQTEGESAIRLYRATAAAHSILAKDGRPDHRIPADL